MSIRQRIKKLKQAAKGRIIVLINTAGSLGWSAGSWWYDNWKTVAVAITILVIIGIIVGSANPRPPTTSKSPLARALRGV